MRFTTPTRKFIWAAGAGIESRGGAVTRPEALGLYDYCAGEAARAQQGGDLPAARFLAHVAIQAFEALRETARWARADRA